MHNPEHLNNLIIAALTGIIKQIKAIRYYPPNHPALQASNEECLQSFEPVFSHCQSLSLVVRKENFLLDDQTIGQKNQLLSQLSHFCFARRIQRLTFLDDLESRDLYHFVHYLLLDPQFIQSQGGVQAILEKARVTTIWVNIHDLEEILERREKIEALPEDPNFDPNCLLFHKDNLNIPREEVKTLDLKSLLTTLEQEPSDSRFQHLLQELIPMLRSQLMPENHGLVLKALLLLCRQATSKKGTKDRRLYAKKALEQLTNDDMVNYLADYLHDDNTPEKVRNTLIKILAFLSKQAAEQMMQILCNQESSLKRKFLTKALALGGPSVLPVIQQYLNSEHWYSVRNAVIILGDIRNQESVPALSQMLKHQDTRVRRETIRTLTKIGGEKSIQLLLQTAAESDLEMRRHAIISLGAMQAQSAIPTLLALLKQKGWSQRDIDLKKESIRALGEIRADEAVPELSRMLKRKSWFRKQLNDELRAAAATALGDIGGESARETLQSAVNDRSSHVARTAAAALKHLG